MSIYHINTRDIKSFSDSLIAGDEVFLSGEVYTARDAAHKKIMALLDNNQLLPFELMGSCIYYAGPTPSRPGLPIGSCGPTTSSRMDVFAPRLLDLGLSAMIGKGKRSPEVIDAIKRNKAVYFCSIGGAGALAAMCIKQCEVIAFDELGCESIKRLVLEDFPVYTAIDCFGNSIFKD